MKPKLLKSSQGYYLAHVSTTTEKPISQSGYIESYEEAKAMYELWLEHPDKHPLGIFNQLISK